MQNFRLEFCLEVCVQGYTSCENIVGIHPYTQAETYFTHIACFYLVDSLEISVYFNIWWSKLMCKISDWDSISKFVFKVARPVKTQYMYIPMPKLRPISHTSHGSIWSILLKFQYNPTFGDLNWCAKFQTGILSRSLCSRLHVLWKHSRYTSLYPSWDLFHTHRMLLFGRFSWNFSIIPHLVI